jgi:septal ring factor EnvC (AmiA/AmiB activator)
MPRGNPLLSRLAKVEGRVDKTEHRLDAHDRELHEVNLDIATLADVVMRSHRRHRARLSALARASRARRHRDSD